ncbi:peptide/nickel transport system ATP-binding protein [Sedimentibacter acidaminivorans]|jgi:peptide/nickel transport system ATP-binding protein|uniref:Peptide/nickel transport system ATP-binding protein n=1 Tax=Sedimentibacter acidaminivorans TaxID=913099 RepID=A0ABS4GBH4_9FIRM|nr:ABC transporter ATP-binding protein [Sedimentibacter acidaminivorans]MBP1925026.1 peptide/nickel transport system ATP-binding protein [Sedimentibacter acidaminivorans]
MKLLELNNVSIDYKTIEGNIRAVDKICLSIEDGEILGLVGESGCGKTTLIKSIIGLLPQNGTVAEGEIFFENENLLKLTKDEMRKKRWKDISMITQSAMNSLNPVYKISWQIVEAIQAHKEISKEDAYKRAEELFELVGLEKGRLNDYPHQYSGGMKQRAIIAMALALNPKIIIADEPTTALDVIVQSQILERINKLLENYQGSMILVTHDMSVIAQTCTKVAVMYGGKIVEYGEVNQVFKEPNHPYTMGLKNAFPSLVGEKNDLISIPGIPPNLLNEIKGCRFKDRCPFSIEKCSQENPKKTNIEEGFFYCHREEEREKLRVLASKQETWLQENIKE